MPNIPESAIESVMLELFDIQQIPGDSQSVAFHESKVRRQAIRIIEMYRRKLWQPMSTCPPDEEDRLFAVMVRWSDGSERPDVVKGVMWTHSQPDEDTEDKRPIIYSGEYSYRAFAWMELPGLPLAAA